jgi:hypothetical protein
LISGLVNRVILGNSKSAQRSYEEEGREVMMCKIPQVIYALIGLCLCTQARGQSNARLTCQGTMADVNATLSGVRQYAPYNPLGDGYVKFVGNVSAGGVSGRITYEGYTQSAPFDGLITSLGGQLSIRVLDNTGGQMIIYDGGASLGPPQIIGRFICGWQ